MQLELTCLGFKKKMCMLGICWKTLSQYVDILLSCLFVFVLRMG